jgi:predicted hydrolase (HD superfamily)
MNKITAIDLLHANMQNQNLRRHCYGVATAMGGIYDYLKESGKFNGDSPDNKEAWEVFGILHDSDYELTKDDWSKHTLVALEWLYQHGVDKNDPLYLGLMSHNNKITKLREPQTQMEWALECCDELSGFIVAVSLVKGGKISDVDVSSVQKKWKQKAFAAAVDRSQTEQVQEKLGIELEKFMEVVLNAMKANKEELGLS